MTTQIRLFLIVSLVVSLAVSNAGADSVSIPNTFVAGDPAVANEVNQNFSAVAGAVNDNDTRITANTAAIANNSAVISEHDERITENANGIIIKQNRVNGTCPETQSIRAIAADGNVICEPDDDSGGDITAVTAAAGLSGGGTAGDVTLGIADGGVDSLQIADGSITDADINVAAAIAVSKLVGDVGFNFSANLTDLENIQPGDLAIKNMGDVTITAPTAGFVLVIHTGFIVFFGDATEIDVGSGTSPTAFTDSIQLGRLDGESTNRFEIPYASVSVIDVDAGDNTFHALAQRNEVFDDNEVNIVPQNLVAIFIAKRY